MVHSFDLNGTDGYNPEAGLIDVSGVLYGTTGYGGQGSLGTVFAVTTTGQERVVHSFGKGVDGAVPQAGLLSVNGVLYGTTTAGGQYNTNGISDGTIFAVTTTGQERVVHSFGSGRTDGNDPLAGLVDVNGVLYGTTSGGGQGKYGVGAVFEVTTGGTERIVYSFGSSATDGNGPEAGLIDVNGVLYGTTYAGGRIGGGTVFAVTPSGKERVLHSFGFGT